MGVTSPELLSFIAVLGSEKAGEYFSMPTVERRELEELLGLPSPSVVQTPMGVRVPGEGLLWACGQR